MKVNLTNYTEGFLLSWDKFMSEINMNGENDKLNKSFRGYPVEIRGWDRIVLVASNIENEGMEYVMGEMYSP